MKPIDLTELEFDAPVIDLNKCFIDNTLHKFGETKRYIYVKVEFGDNVIANCLLTKNQILVGIKRALRNQEDCPLTESFSDFMEKSSKGEENNVL